MENFKKENALGYINFDPTAGTNNEVEVRIPYNKIAGISRGKYIIIISEGKDLYLARITKGPFYTPDAVNRDSAFARASIVQADAISFMPDYHAICFCELIGALDSDITHVFGIHTRPRPKSPVFPIPPEKLAKLLNIDGNMYLGQVTGYEDIRVKLDADKKSILPRNVGIFGTVGSGKTNSSQVLIEEACAAGWAVIVIDIEGEYISMDMPSTEITDLPPMKELAKKFKIEAMGLEKFQVYVPSNGETERKDACPFCIPFGNFSPYELAEIMGMNDTQTDRFMELWHEQREKTGKPSKKSKNQWEMIDEGEDEFDHLGITIDALDATLNSKLKIEKGSSRSSWLVVRRLIGRLKRFGIFDTDVDSIDIDSLLKAGKVSVFDVSNSVNTQVNNIVIAYLLKKVFEKKRKNKELPHTLIFIEEAHSFVSKENARKMEALMDRLREVTRRGRKRWLGLCFISQQPSHLPDEIYELCNTKIIHQTMGNKNLNALKTSAGNVNEAIWDDVPTLGQGRCIIVSPQFQHPIMTNMRPSKTKREHIN